MAIRQIARSLMIVAVALLVSGFTLWNVAKNEAQHLWMQELKQTSYKSAQHDATHQALIDAAERRLTLGRYLMIAGGGLLIFGLANAFFARKADAPSD